MIVLEEFKKVMCVYGISNKITGRLYIGSTKDLHARTMIHKRLLEREIHECTRMLSDWCDYGADSFEVKILERVADASALRAVEQKHIDSNANLYNTRRSLRSQKAAIKLKKVPKIFKPFEYKNGTVKIKPENMISLWDYAEIHHRGWPWARFLVKKKILPSITIDGKTFIIVGDKLAA